MRGLWRFLRRHRDAEETVGTAVGLDLIWQLLAGAGLFAAGVASAAVLTASPTSNPNSRLSLSTKGAAFVTRNEGVRYVPYNDPLNCTVGVGHLIHYGICSGYDYAHWRITPAQSAVLLLHDSAGAASCVRTLTRPLNQAQFDALLDLTFNAGCGALDYSGIRNLVDGGDLAAVPARLRVTAVTASGVYLAGLATRRASEAVLWATGFYGAGIGYALPPKPPTVRDLLKAKTGFYAWLGWYLGEKPFGKFGRHNPQVRPHVPARVPSVWWRRERRFVAART